MKQILTTLGNAELEMLRGLLEHAGIACELQDGQPAHHLPPKAFGRELWVVKEWDYARAIELCQSWCGPAQNPLGFWICPICRQRVHVQFDACWKCGEKREPQNKPI